jgi:hypothetical protein
LALRLALRWSFDIGGMVEVARAAIRNANKRSVFRIVVNSTVIFMTWFNRILRVLFFFLFVLGGALLR